MGCHAACCLRNYKRRAAVSPAGKENVFLAASEAMAGVA